MNTQLGGSYMLETIVIIIKTVLIVLMLLMSIILHRIGTIRKWEIEKEREEAKQTKEESP